MKVSKKWRDLLGLIPGYDCFATAAPGEKFDESEAEMRIEFIQELKHVEGALAGKPFILEPWQKAIVGCLFGWKRADGSRRYRKFLEYVARKNGKTPLAAAIAASIWFQDDEGGKVINCAAADADQASHLFRHAWGMISQTPELADMVQHYKSFRSIVFKNDDASTFKVIAADGPGEHGKNPSAVLIDELHVVDNRDLLEAITTSFVSLNRKEPLLMFLTTADYNRPSICNEEHEYACKVRDGIIKDSSYLPVIYELTDQDDWTDEQTWYKANPNLGVSVSLEALQREFQRAKEMPTYENAFKRFHLNMMTEQDVRWLQMEKWDACNGAADEESCYGESAFVGIDLAATKDIAAVVHYFPESGIVVPRLYVPEEQARERERRDGVPYLTWGRQGLIRLTPGSTVDYEYIRREIIADNEKWRIVQIGIDRWNHTQITNQLQGDGFEVFGFGQGYASMSGPMKQTEILILNGKIAHGGNEPMRWMASNVAVEMDAAGNIKPNKKKSTEKIDGIVALIEAIGCAWATDRVKSKYEDQELAHT